MKHYSSKERTCSCGEKETQKIDKLEHTHKYGEWAVVKEATETEEGSKERVCSCGEKETEAIAKLEHTHEYGEWVVAETNYYILATVEGTCREWINNVAYIEDWRTGEPVAVENFWKEFFSKESLMKAYKENMLPTN